MKPTVFLFDIDGTLISSGGAARGALLRGLATFLGRESVSLSFSFAGMTDRSILRMGLTELGAAVTEERIDDMLEVYLQGLQDAVTHAEHFRVHPGVRELLEWLEGRPGIALGIGTGNVERGARIKLERVALNRYFSFGGFGCDAEARPALIAAGAKRGAHQLGLPLAQCRVVVIGDTPKDVQAAHANDAQCIAVATGGASEEALAASKPEWLFSNLAQDGVREALLG